MVPVKTKKKKPLRHEGKGQQNVQLKARRQELIRKKVKTGYLRGKDVQKAKESFEKGSGAGKGEETRPNVENTRCRARGNLPKKPPFKGATDLEWNRRFVGKSTIFKKKRSTEKEMASIISNSKCTLKRDGKRAGFTGKIRKSKNITSRK